jgi:hypothetical protein
VDVPCSAQDESEAGVLPNGSTSAVSHVAAVKKTDQDGLFMA